MQGAGAALEDWWTASHSVSCVCVLCPKWLGEQSWPYIQLARVIEQPRHAALLLQNPALLTQVSITPIRHPGNGCVANWVAVIGDISKRKAAEAAMQMREQALRWAAPAAVGMEAAAWGAAGHAAVEGPECC